MHVMRTPDLVAPTRQCRASFVAALVEFQAEGRYLDLDPALLIDPAAFAVYVDALRSAAAPDPARPPNIIQYTALWYVDRADFVGRVRIRHELTPALREDGGHIGFDVRPSARRQGHATRML